MTDHVGNRLARALVERVTDWYDQTGTLDPTAERCIVAGLKTRSGVVVYAMSRYRDGRYCLAVFAEDSAPGKVTADQDVLAECWAVAVSRVEMPAAGEG